MHHKIMVHGYIAALEDLVATKNQQALGHRREVQWTIRDSITQPDAVLYLDLWTSTCPKGSRDQTESWQQYHSCTHWEDLGIYLLSAWILRGSQNLMETLCPFDINIIITGQFYYITFFLWSVFPCKPQPLLFPSTESGLTWLFCNC